MHRKDRYEYLKHVVELCAWCSCEFTPPSGTTMYCSHKCATAASKAGKFESYVSQDRVCARCKQFKVRRKFRWRDDVCKECRSKD